MLIKKILVLDGWNFKKIKSNIKSMFLIRMKLLLAIYIMV